MLDFAFSVFHNLTSLKFGEITITCIIKSKTIESVQRKKLNFDHKPQMYFHTCKNYFCKGPQGSSWVFWELPPLLNWGKI